MNSTTEPLPDSGPAAGPTASAPKGSGSAADPVSARRLPAAPAPTSPARLAWPARPVVTVVAPAALAVVFWPHEVGGGAGRGGVSDPRGTASGGDAERGDSNQGGFLLAGRGAGGVATAGAPRRGATRSGVIPTRAASCSTDRGGR